MRWWLFLNMCIGWDQAIPEYVYGRGQGYSWICVLGGITLFLNMCMGLGQGYFWIKCMGWGHGYSWIKCIRWGQRYFLVYCTPYTLFRIIPNPTSCQWLIPVYQWFHKTNIIHWYRYVILLTTTYKHFKVVKSFQLCDIWKQNIEFYIYKMKSQHLFKLILYLIM